MDDRGKLSALWVFVMFNMLAADVISFLDGAFLAQLMTGYAGEIRITSTFQLAAAIMIEIPIAMIVLSRVLSSRWNRMVNPVAALVTAAFIVGGGSTSPHYLFFAAAELAALGAIARLAWSVPRATPVETRVDAAAA
jgi:Family of unknown function (DUF6326)